MRIDIAGPGALQAVQKVAMRQMDVAIGRVVTIGRTARTVVGVMPAGFGVLDLRPSESSFFQKGARVFK